MTLNVSWAQDWPQPDPAPELVCLAKNIYYEARGETTRGQLAVAQVTLNRAEQQNKTICEVVYQPNQFSWTKLPPKMVSYESWITAIALASEVLERGWAILNFPALYFHNHTVQPQWQQRRLVATIGNHHFYR